MEIEKLYPECKDYLWGGEKLKTEYGKVTDKSPCAESWELSFHSDGLTKLKSGKALKDVVSKTELGDNVANFQFFPTLIKFIDAKNDLSVQVHPSDDYALKNENSFGKTEMWYIVEAEEGAGIYLGFKKDVTFDEYKNAILNHTLTDLLNFYEVKKGESYFIPSGTIHAICKGCLICEIQQNSNLTYRVYDYGRKDKNGKERELHIEKALKVTNLNKFVAQKSTGEIIGQCKYFTTKKYEISGKKECVADRSSFISVTCVDGSGEINGKPINSGDTYFVPSGYGKFTIKGNLTVILVNV